MFGRSYGYPCPRFLSYWSGFRFQTSARVRIRNSKMCCDFGKAWKSGVLPSVLHRMSLGELFVSWRWHAGRQDVLLWKIILLCTDVTHDTVLPSTRRVESIPLQGRCPKNDKNSVEFILYSRKFHQTKQSKVATATRAWDDTGSVHQNSPFLRLFLRC